MRTIFAGIDSSPCPCPCPGRGHEMSESNRGILSDGASRSKRKGESSTGLRHTGHGLGLETHEPPDMVEGNLLALEPGMTFTIEPGIYFPGEVGVRIEDNVVVTAEGCESLTTFDRELRVIR